MADQVTVQILVSAVQGDTTVVGSFPQTVMATAPAGIYANTEGVAPVSGSPATLTYGGLTTPNGVWILNTDDTSSITLKVGTTTAAQTLAPGDPPAFLVNPETVTIASSSASVTATYSIVAYNLAAA